MRSRRSVRARRHHKKPVERPTLRPASVPTWLAVVTILIAGASLYTGYQSWRAGARQERVARLQYEVMQAQVQPEFVLKVKTKIGRDFFPWLIVHWPSHVLVPVINDGFPVRDVRLYPMATIDIRIMEGDEVGGHDLLVPIGDGTFVQWGFRSTKGTLANVGFGDFKKERQSIGRLERLFLAARRNESSPLPPSYRPLQFNLIFCTIVKYVDALGARHRELYVIGPNVSERIPSDLADKIIRYWVGCARSNAAYLVIDMGSPARDSVAKRMWNATVKAYRRQPGADELWPAVETALARSGGTGVDVDPYTWPMDFPPPAPKSL